MLDVMTLPPFRYLGFYVFQVCASIFWASLAARALAAVVMLYVSGGQG